ncbi:MAG: hypothetical protein KGI33_06925 [Thaumarchaeota archaeon]|nr:hypothetical protein [Nitrososphaerota archaeon]
MSGSRFEDTNPGQPGSGGALLSKELRKISEDMKNDLQFIIKSMEDAIKFSMDEKTKATALKSLVLEKEEEVRKTSDEIVSTEKRITSNESAIAGLEKELNSVKTAIQGIKEITSELDPLDAERAADSLKGTLIKKQTDLEKSRGDLNSSIKLKDLAMRRLGDAERSLQNAKKHYSEKMAGADLLAENVEKSFSHIVQAYRDVITVSKELLMEILDSRQSTQSGTSAPQTAPSANVNAQQRPSEQRKDEGLLGI